MQQVQIFMAETRDNFASINKKMGDIESVVEVLYANYHSKILEDEEAQEFVHSEQSPLETADTFDAAFSHLEVGNVRAAYAKLIKGGDGLQLGRLMQKTGPVLDKLEEHMITELFIRIIQFLKSRTFVELALAWVHQAVKMGTLPLDKPHFNTLVSVLQDISADPSKHGIEAAQLLVQIRKLSLLWGKG